MYTSTIVDRCTQKLVDDWNAMRCQVGAPRGLPAAAPKMKSMLFPQIYLSGFSRRLK